MSGKRALKERVLACRKRLDPYGKLDNWTGYLFDQAWLAGYRAARRKRKP